jgi:hypothetical protein
VQYLTRPEIVREVLPPPLEHAAEPLVTVGIGSETLQLRGRV